MGKRIQGGKMVRLLTMKTDPPDDWGTTAIVKYEHGDEIPESMRYAKIVSIEHVMVVK